MSSSCLSLGTDGSFGANITVRDCSQTVILSQILKNLQHIIDSTCISDFHDF